MLGTSSEVLGTSSDMLGTCSELARSPCLTSGMGVSGVVGGGALGHEFVEIEVEGRVWLQISSVSIETRASGHKGSHS